MPKYNEGDVVVIDGQEMTLGSWPESDEGPFFASYTTSNGAVVQGTYWTSVNKISSDLTAPERDVHPGEPTPPTDFNDLDDLDPSVPAGHQSVTPGENAKAAAGIGNSNTEGHLPGPESNLAGNDTDELEPVHAVSDGKAVEITADGEDRASTNPDDPEVSVQSDLDVDQDDAIRKVGLQDVDDRGNPTNANGGKNDEPEAGDN